MVCSSLESYTYFIINTSLLNDYCMEKYVTEKFNYAFKRKRLCLQNCHFNKTKKHLFKQEQFDSHLVIIQYCFRHKQRRQYKLHK